MCRNALGQTRIQEQRGAGEDIGFGVAIDLDSCRECPEILGAHPKEDWFARRVEKHDRRGFHSSGVVALESTARADADWSLAIRPEVRIKAPAVENVELRQSYSNGHCLRI